MRADVSILMLMESKLAVEWQVDVGCQVPVAVYFHHVHTEDFDKVLQKHDFSSQQLVRDQVVLSFSLQMSVIE